jgi:hypothetical protein
MKLIPAKAPDVRVKVVLEEGKECKMGYLGHNHRQFWREPA